MIILKAIDLNNHEIKYSKKPQALFLGVIIQRKFVELFTLTNN